jgi:hypothetical protein
MAEERKKIEKMLSKLSLSERIAILESLGKQYRRENSIRLNENQVRGAKLVDPERPYLIEMK